MRYLALLLLPLAAVAPAQDNDRGPGIVPTRQGNTLVYPVRDFTGVGLGLGAQVEVRTGGAFGVVVTGPASAFGNFRIARDRDGLNIGHRYRDRHGNEALERQIVVRVTMPRLDSAALGGSGRILVDRVSGDGFDASIGGSGNIGVGQLAVNRATISIGGSGNFRGAGSARELKVNIGGSGSVEAPALRASGAEIASAGSGSVRADVRGPASITLVGSGSVDLGPAARCTTTRMGSGRVRCGG